MRALIDRSWFAFPHSPWAFNVVTTAWWSPRPAPRPTMAPELLALEQIRLTVAQHIQNGVDNADDGGAITVAAPSANEEGEDEKCVICLADDRIFAFVPCGHRCLCAACCFEMVAWTPMHVVRCPVCRMTPATVCRIYL